MQRIIRIALVLALLVYPASALSEQSCSYISEDGVIVAVNSIDKVPEQLKLFASCRVVKKGQSSKKDGVKTSSSKEKRSKKIISNEEPKPPASNQSSTSKKRSPRADKVKLNKLERKRIIKTSLGKVNLRWEASVEKYIDRQPVKDITNSMRAAARVLGQPAFPSTLKNLNYDWRIVIMGEVPEEVDITVNGQGRCHPGWIRRGSDVYISLERIATNCGKKEKTEEETIRDFRETIVHEIGHAIEYKILGRNYRHSERWHREGFAMWFESRAANFLTGKGKNRSKIHSHAKKYWDNNWNPNDFKGSYQDYTRGYAMIAALADKLSVHKLQNSFKKTDSTFKGSRRRAKVAKKEVLQEGST
jgi:hypothetical protein